MAVLNLMPEPGEMVLDPQSFVAAERLECQVRFDTPYGDLLRAILESVHPNRDSSDLMRIVDAEGTRCWPDQIIAFMLWVQLRRDHPSIELASLEDLSFADLAGAVIRGVQSRGKAETPKSSTKSRRGSDSSSGSEEA